MQTGDNAMTPISDTPNSQASSSNLSASSFSPHAMDASVLVVSNDPTVRAVLVALCRSISPARVTGASVLPSNSSAHGAILVIVDPGDGSQGVARTILSAAVFSAPVLVIPPAWRDSLLAGVLGDSAVVVPEIAVVVAAALAAGRGIGVDDSEGAALGVREKEVITLVASGLTDDQIADALGIASSTVRSHLDRIGQKTGARRRPAIVRLAQQRGLIPDEPQGKA
jgi:DNA-binding CsgD family transcriptional regulator